MIKIIKYQKNLQEMIQNNQNSIQNKERDNIQTKTLSNKRQLVQKIHDAYFTEIRFKQIDYIIGQPLPVMLEQSQNKQLNHIVIFAEQCLAFTEKGFDILYYYLLKVVINQSQEWNFRNKASDLLITMNGQNEKVYNLKKKAIRTMTHKLQSQQDDDKNVLDIERQLKLNAAIAMKNKKSSSVYEYRIWLIEYLIKHNKLVNKQKLEDFVNALHQREHIIMTAILERFARNYFCCMYRLRLFKIVTRILNNQDVYIRQIGMVEKFVSKNPNDYSSLSYYRFLINNSTQTNFHHKIIDLILQKCNQMLQFSKLAYEQSNDYRQLTIFYNQMSKGI